MLKERKMRYIPQNLLHSTEYIITFAFYVYKNIRFFKKILIKRFREKLRHTEISNIFTQIFSLSYYADLYGIEDGKMGKKIERRNSHRLKQTSTDTW